MLALKIARAIDWLNQIAGRIMYWLGLLMVLLGVYNAAARYLGSYIGQNLSSNAYFDAQWYLFGAMFLLGAGYGLQHDVHVRVDVIYSQLGPKGQAWINILGTILFLLPFCALVIWLSLDWVANSWAYREGPSYPGGLARYPIKTIVPVAFALLFLQGLSQLIKHVAVLRGHTVNNNSEHTGGGSL